LRHSTVIELSVRRGTVIEFPNVLADRHFEIATPFCLSLILDAVDFWEKSRVSEHHIGQEQFDLWKAGIGIYPG
jgi:hypothetical protein